jgi:hypothetical protein
VILNIKEHSITAWVRAVLQKLTVIHLVKKFPTFLGTYVHKSPPATRLACLTLYDLVKVKLPLCLIKHRAMKTYGGEDV